MPIKPLLLALTLIGSAGVGADDAPPTAIDLMQQFLSHPGALDASAAAQLLDQSILGQTRVPAEHLGIAFWDKRTGQRLDRQIIREIAGPVRQDGAYQMLSLALGFNPAGLPFDQDQLERLMDAAFVASLRRPPEYIDIEYYDLRQGPSGLGGGVSGSVPDTATARPKLPAPPSQTQSSEQPHPSEIFESQKRLVATMTELDIALPAPLEGLLLPIVVWSQEPDQLVALAKQEIDQLETMGAQLLRLSEQPIIQYDGHWHTLLTLGDFRPMATMNRHEHQVAKQLHQELLNGFQSKPR